jgi:hypothetical protein
MPFEDPESRLGLFVCRESGASSAFRDGDNAIDEAGSRLQSDVESPRKSCECNMGTAVDCPPLMRTVAARSEVSSLASNRLASLSHDAPIIGAKDAGHLSAYVSGACFELRLREIRREAALPLQRFDPFLKTTFEPEAALYVSEPQGSWLSSAVVVTLKPCVVRASA